MYAPFTHEYGTGYIEYDWATSSRIPRTLIVSAHAPLTVSAAGYDQDKVKRLEAVVTSFADEIGLDRHRIVFAQGAIRAAKPSP
jgi:hypothetical protein